MRRESVMNMKLLWVGIASLCLSAAPAMADLDLFTFNVTAPQVTYNPSSSPWQFQVTPKASLTTGGFVTDGDTAWADFKWPSATGDFFLGMNLGGTGNTRSGNGVFTYTDKDGDYITGSLTGEWKKIAGGNQFNGALNGVTFASKSDYNFDGNNGGSVAMTSLSTLPWSGAIQVQLSSQVPWFDVSFDKSMSGGGVTGVVSTVPIPGAVLLGFLGLSAAGLGLRKLA
jgi:hypothetical protein